MLHRRKKTMLTWLVNVREQEHCIHLSIATFLGLREESRVSGSYGLGGQNGGRHGMAGERRWLGDLSLPLSLSMCSAYAHALPVYDCSNMSLLSLVGFRDRNEWMADRSEDVLHAWGDVPSHRAIPCWFLFPGPVLKWLRHVLAP
jgi:hypothetical protein